jgi:hypothetical protein
VTEVPSLPRDFRNLISASSGRYDDDGQPSIADLLNCYENQA